VAQNLGLSEGDRFSYTGNSRHDFLVDLEKFGGMPHGKFAFTLENLWGEFGNVNGATGSMTPAVFNSIMPIDTEASGIPYVTNFVFVQPVSEKLILSVGKTRLANTADSNIFAGGDGSDQFLNQAFVANALFVPQLPISTFAVGAVSPRDWGNISLMIADPVDRATQFMDFGDLFAQGAIVFGQIKVNTNFGGLPGEQHVGGFYKNRDLQDLAFVPNQPIYPELTPLPGFQTRPESYTVFYGFDQFLMTYGEAKPQPNSPRATPKGWGLFGRAGLADNGTGNPNFNAWHVSAGIGGDSPILSRMDKGDRFGIGYAYTGTSNEWGALPQALVGPRDAQIWETYYRYQLTPSIQITPDVQWMRGIFGGLTNGDDAWVFGIRMNINL
jgi:porin